MALTKAHNAFQIGHANGAIGFIFKMLSDGGFGLGNWRTFPNFIPRNCATRNLFDMFHPFFIKHVILLQQFQVYHFFQLIQEGHSLLECIL